MAIRTHGNSVGILYTRDDEQAGTNIEQQSNKQLSSFSVCLPVVLVFPGSSAYKQSWSVNLSTSSSGTQSDCSIYCKQSRDGRTDRHTDGAQGTTASLLLLSRHNDSLRPTHTHSLMGRLKHETVVANDFHHPFWVGCVYGVELIANCAVLAPDAEEEIPHPRLFFRRGCGRG